MRLRFWPVATVILLLSTLLGAAVNSYLRSSLDGAEARTQLFSLAISPHHLLENLSGVELRTRGGEVQPFSTYLDGRPVVMGLFRLDDCQPCLKKFDVLDQLAAEFGSDVHTMLIVIGDTTQLTDFARSSLLPHSPILLDPSGSILWCYGNAPTPSICSVDRTTGTGFCLPLLELPPGVSPVIRDGFRATVHQSLERSNE